MDLFTDDGGEDPSFDRLPPGVSRSRAAALTGDRFVYSYQGAGGGGFNSGHDRGQHRAPAGCGLRPRLPGPGAGLHQPAVSRTGPARARVGPAAAPAAPAGRRRDRGGPRPPRPDRRASPRRCSTLDDHADPVAGPEGLVLRLEGRPRREGLTGRERLLPGEAVAVAQVEEAARDGPVFRPARRQRAPASGGREPGSPRSRLEPRVAGIRASPANGSRPVKEPVRPRGGRELRASPRSGGVSV